MNSQALAYLQTDQIGKVIAKGLADLYTHQPHTPVQYLAQWLKNYSANQKQLDHLQAIQHQKVEHVHSYNKTVQIKRALSAEQQKKLHDHELKITKFNETVANHEYQEELLAQVFPEFVEKLLELTGVYIGYLNHPTKSITDQDDDQNAHLNTGIPKLINYIGSSKSHTDLMLGKTLELEKGLTGSAFSLSLDDPAIQVGEDGVEVVAEKKNKYLYIPNVVKNQNLHYFRLPKLGSYIAIPLAYHSYLKQNIFDAALDARIKVLADLEEFTTNQTAALEEIQKEIEEHQKKIAELAQKNAEEGLIQAANQELAASKAKKAQKQQQKFVQESSDLPLENREFVVCGDTLGTDSEISESNRDLLVSLVKHFRDSWQEKEKELLQKDVEFQIQYRKEIEQTNLNHMEHLEKCIEITPEAKAEIEKAEEEHIKNYKTIEWQFQALKKEILSNEEYLRSYLKLNNFRVVKFKELLQVLFFFLKQEKAQINLPGRTELNWKKVRTTHINKQTFHAIVDYIVEGPKTAPYPTYCKLSFLLEKLEAFNENDLFNYNIGLGGLTKFVKLALNLRQSNVELRKIEKQNERKRREIVVEQNEKIKEEKRQALQKHKGSLSSEDVEALDEEEWGSKYDEEFPLKEIPPEIVDDVDNDI